MNIFIILVVLGVIIYFIVITKNLFSGKYKKEREDAYEAYFQTFFDSLIYDFSIIKENTDAKKIFMMISDYIPDSNDINDHYKFYEIKLFIIDTRLAYSSTNSFDDWYHAVDDKLFKHEKSLSSMFYNEKYWSIKSGSDVNFKCTDRIMHPYAFCNQGMHFKKLGLILQSRYGEKYPNIIFDRSDTSVILQ